MILSAFKKFSARIKNPWWVARKKYIKFYETLPVDERMILLESQHGAEMSGNIFYILRYLNGSEKYQDFTIYLTAKAGKVKQFEGTLAFYGLDRVNIVVLGSEEYYRIIASAKYLVNDNTFLPFFMKKEEQVYINTWHGTPLKSLGKQIKSDAHAIGNAQRNFVFADYITFPNEHTRDAIIKDYMIENISRGSYIFCGYPRNEIFFDKERASSIRRALELEGKKLYAYMPTFRGQAAKGGTSKNTHYLNYYLYELDARLNDDEILYVNLHPVAKKDVVFTQFKHIRNFPKEYETYDFLNACDVLVSDYSSVFFDYACSGRKIVLFTYDKEEYLADRGMYLSMDELPFPQVGSVDTLLYELRSGKNYDDSAFLERFAKYENPKCSEMLCDSLMLGIDTGLCPEPIPDNGKENVLIYSGNLAGNGITASLFSLLRTLDLDKRNYYVTFRTESVYKNRHMLSALPEGVSYFATGDDMNLTIGDHIVRAFFKGKRLSTKRYMANQKTRVTQGFIRNYANAKFDAAIQFNGYESEVILQFATFPGKRTIFVHSDMLEEIKTKGNQRFDVLEYAYRNYDNVAIVTEDMRAPTLKISGKAKNIKVVKNAINYRAILEKSEEDFAEGSYQKCSVDFETANAALNSDAIKFINIGRFAPEKGQDRLIDAFAAFNKENPNSYLFIIGGYSLCGLYESLNEKIQGLGLGEKVILLLTMPNPYTVLKKCDYFILSSHYEGFGLVLAEADILGKPAISTDIAGPRTFMQAHGGTLVGNSTAGILEGMYLLKDGKVPVMNVDYEKYNDEVREQFDSLF